MDTLCSLNIGTVNLRGHCDGSTKTASSFLEKNTQDCSTDYHADMTAEVFEEWMRWKLLKLLPEPSVIVYYSRLMKRSQADTYPGVQLGRWSNLAELGMGMRMYTYSYANPSFGEQSVRRGMNCGLYYVCE